MSDREDDRGPLDDGDDEDRHLDTEETSGLGLTEEFARIESEIEHATDEHSGRPAETGESGELPIPEPPEPEAGHDQATGEGTVEWDVAADTGDQEWEPETGESGSWDTGSYEAEHDTGEWADATGEHEHAATGEHELADRRPLTGEEDSLREDDGDGDGETLADEPAPPPPPAAAPADPATRVQRTAPLVPPSADPASERPTEVRRPTQTGSGSLTPIPPGPAAVAAEEPEIKVPSLWLRFLSGSVLIVVSVAASVAVAGLLFIGDIAAKLQPIPGIQQQLSQVESDAPQTVLIIGSDRRDGDPPGSARSDTAMLLRVDPEKDVLSLFSLPRDLKVNIPGYGIGKLNEAYTYGGEELTLKTVKRFTGLDINHVVEINFQGFADAVNAIDCVYIDVDRHYFNDNSTALSEADTYAEIDISAGYQRLCGLKALQYVRYRHADTDLVRAARQQDFLREARQKVNPRELIPAPIVGGDTGNQLIDIFTEYTRSDISSSSDILGILKSFIAVRSAAVNEVHFEGDIGDATNTYVTSTTEQLNEAIDRFLNGSVVDDAGDEGKPKKDKDNDKDKSKKKKKDKKDKDEGGIADANVIPVEQLPMAEDPAAFENDARKNARRLDFPIFSLTVAPPEASFDRASRTYDYENEDNKREKAYKTVVRYAPSTALPEYFGVEGTTWEDPPILRNPSETREIDGREYDLFYDGERLRLVGWHEDGNSYWLNNTLTQSLDEDQMLAMATTMNVSD